MAADFLRSDEPVVLVAGPAAHPCATCEHWSQWLSETGDCMRYAWHRREAMLAASTTPEELEAFHLAWPVKSARVTSGNETCAGWVQRMPTKVAAA